jgi:putative endonuclease
MHTTELGTNGEDIAARFLEDLGYRILERNYRFDRAEVDLICFEPATDYAAGGQLVFVEVKTRRGERFGRPEDALTEAKKKSLLRAAEAYLHERRLDGSPCRFDVVAIALDQADGMDLQHFKDAFWIF